MPGNSSRRGAMRKAGTKKGPQVGSGGQRRKALAPKGPTPKASERTGHVASRRAARAAKAEDLAAKGSGRGPGKSAAKSAGKSAATSARSAGSAPRSGGSRSPKATPSYEYLAGRNPVLEALQARVPASTCYVMTGIDLDDRVREAMRLVTTRGIPLLEVTRTDLDRMTDHSVHQGIALRIPPYAYADPRDLTGASLLIALDGITDPRNLGAIARSAAAFGADGVVVPERRAAGVTAGAWKASAGALTRICVARTVNLTRELTALKKAGFTVIGLDGASETSIVDLTAEVLRDPIVLVVGSEDVGMARLVRETCDLVVSIPMIGGTESLNASVAAGIALYAVASARS